MTADEALALALQLQAMNPYEAAIQLINLSFEAEKRGAASISAIYKEVSHA